MELQLLGVGWWFSSCLISSLVLQAPWQQSRWQGWFLHSHHELLPETAKSNQQHLTALWKIFPESSVSTKLMPKARTLEQNIKKKLLLWALLSWETALLKARPSAQSWVWNNNRGLMLCNLLVGQKEMRKNSCEVDFYPRRSPRAHIFPGTERTGKWQWISRHPRVWQVFPYCPSWKLSSSPKLCCPRVLLRGVIGLGSPHISSVYRYVYNIYRHTSTANNSGASLLLFLLLQPRKHISFRAWRQQLSSPASQPYEAPGAIYSRSP